MKITVNSARYDPEDLAPAAFDLCIRSISLYNHLKIRMYNALYAYRYLPDSKQDVLRSKNMTYSTWMKAYGINDYYSTSLYSEATGLLSSQRELRKWHLVRMQEDLDARRKKVDSLSASLVNLRAVKQTIVTYAKTGKFKRPYKGCQLKICGQIACPG